MWGATKFFGSYRMLCVGQLRNRKCPPPSAKYPKIHSASAQMGGNVLLRNALRSFLMSGNPCGLTTFSVKNLAEWILDINHRIGGSKKLFLAIWPFRSKYSWIFSHKVAASISCCKKTDFTASRKSLNPRQGFIVQQTPSLFQQVPTFFKQLPMFF